MRPNPPLPTHIHHNQVRVDPTTLRDLLPSLTQADTSTLQAELLGQFKHSHLLCFHNTPTIRRIFGLSDGDPICEGIDNGSSVVL